MKGWKRFCAYALVLSVSVILTGCGGGGGGGGGGTAGTGGGGGTGGGSTGSYGTLLSITITPEYPTVKVGATQQLKAMGLFYNYTTLVYTNVDITSYATWTSSATTVATATSGAGGGVVTGVSTGLSTITASFNYISSSVTLAVANWTAQMYGASIPKSMVWNGSTYVGTGQNSSNGKIWNQMPSSLGNDIAWDGSLYVEVGGTLFSTSPDGATWTTIAVPSTVSFDTFNSVTKSATTWVAVGSGGGILYSTDGANWTAAPTVMIGGAQAYLRSVVWTGTQFVACGNSGALLTSPDGMTWTTQPWANATDTITALGVHNGLIVAGTLAGAIWTATDGPTLSWTQQTATLPFNVNRVAFAGVQWVAVGSSGTGIVSATSTNGATWTNGTAAPAAQLTSVVYNGTGYVATGVDRNAHPAAYASTDGLTWTLLEAGNTQTAAAINPSTGLIVSVGADDSSRASTDSANWTLGPLANNDIFLDVTWSPQAGKFIALLQSGVNPYISTSTDGVTWSPNAYAAASAAPCGNTGATLAASSTVLLTAGTSAGSCIATSTDNGTTWTTGTSPMTGGQSVTKAFWTGSQFVLLGSSGFIATSPDGVTWTTRVSNTVNNLNGGVATATMIVVVGDSGTILTSTNGGVTWASQTSGTSMNLKRVVWTGTLFYAVGLSDTLLSSPNGTTWSTVYSPYSGWTATFPSLTPPDFYDAVWSTTTNKLTVFGTGGMVGTIP